MTWAALLLADPSPSLRLLVLRALLKRPETDDGSRNRQDRGKGNFRKSHPHGHQGGLVIPVTGLIGRDNMQAIGRAHRDQKHPEPTADPGGDSGGPAQVALPLPKDRTQHPTAVEGERRNHVEDNKHDVDDQHQHSKS